MNNIFPGYMSKPFTKSAYPANTNLRSSTYDTLCISKAWIEIFWKSLAYSGPKLIPLHIRQSKTLQKFKSYDINEHACGFFFFSHKNCLRLFVNT